MNSKRFLFCFVISFLFVQSGFAQPASEQQAAPQEEQPPAVVAPPEGDQESDPLREQIIYVPYEKLPQVFEKPARGVFYRTNNSNNSGMPPGRIPCLSLSRGRLYVH